MRHSKPLPQYNGDYVHVYAMGSIVISAHKKTEKRESYIDVNITLEVAKEIQKTLNFSEENNLPLGHSYWHVHNNNLDVDSCWSCQQIRKEQNG